MLKELRTVHYDTQLAVEAYRFEGIMQEFPNHFHDYYVIGFINTGQRHLICKNRDYIISPKDIVIFNPKDTHTCQQVNNKSLDYRCLNIKPDDMKNIVFEITGHAFYPVFQQNVLFRSELFEPLQDLHAKICENETDFIKEELYLFLISQLLCDNSELPLGSIDNNTITQFDEVCEYIEKNYTKSLTLDELCNLVNLSKYHFLRSFTANKGISPYRYLESIRVGHAKKLLKKGMTPTETAILTGFSDQSHLTRYFKKLIGLTPKQYMQIFSSKI